jgi:hypothetical protein
MGQQRTHAPQHDREALIASTLMVFLYGRYSIHIAFLYGESYLGVKAHFDGTVPCKLKNGILKQRNRAATNTT